MIGQWEAIMAALGRKIPPGSHIGVRPPPPPIVGKGAHYVIKDPQGTTIAIVRSISHIAPGYTYRMEWGTPNTAGLTPVAQPHGPFWPHRVGVKKSGGGWFPAATAVPAAPAPIPISPISGMGGIF